jgi:hypothetical protein
MFRKANVLLILIVFATTCFAADSDSASAEISVKDTTDMDFAPVLPEKDSLEYWMVRSQALTELSPFLARIRREAKSHYYALTDYIKYIGKGQEFIDSGINVPFNPAEYAKAIGKSEDFVAKNIDLPEKPMAWEELVEWAMEFVLNEGYAPLDTESKEEIELIKSICKQKEVYAKKVRKGLHGVAQDCMEMKAYLESIDQFEACLKYTRYQKEEKGKARRERSKAGREELASNERRRRELERKNEWAEKQTRIANQYQRTMNARRVRSNYPVGRGHSYYRW